MPDPTATAATDRRLAEAREAKKALLAFSRAAVVGVGLSAHGSGYAIKVNLAEPAVEQLPTSVNGVPILYGVTGRARAL